MPVSFVSGLAALLVSVASWGSAFVPTKLPSIAGLDLDAFVFQGYTVAAVVPTTLIILAWEPFVFTPYGFFGAALWIPANICAVSACRIIGVGIAQSSWAGGICVVSFLWGALGAHLWTDHGCTLTSVPLAILGLLTLIAGIAGLAFSSTADAIVPTVGLADAELASTVVLHSEESAAGDEEKLITKDDVQPDAREGASTTSSKLLSVDMDTDGEGSGLATACPPQPAKPSRLLAGLLRTAGTGVLGGTMMVPLKLATNVSGFQVTVGCVVRL